MGTLVIFIIVFAVSIVFSTAILCAALFVVGDEELSSDTLMKAGGLTIVANLVGLVPLIGAFVAIFVWFGGLMAIFEKTFGEAFLVALAVFVVNLGVSFGIGALMA